MFKTIFLAIMMTLSVYADTWLGAAAAVGYILASIIDD
jgi:hypothetical protein